MSNRNLNYWLYRWASFGPIWRAVTVIPATLIVGAVLAAVLPLLVVEVTLYSVCWLPFHAAKCWGPSVWHNAECRRNAIMGRGYRDYWTKEADYDPD